ncbi:cardiolipin synthase [Bacillaceae bacterium Marseille-Q3522]|nr:cardiolipin synthase [Bacillaceae bacterium Marseille-Q3522]
MDVYTILISLLLFLNICLAMVVIFLERKDASGTWAWLMVLLFIPLLGFLLYLIFGQNLSKNRMFQWEDRKKLGIEKRLAEQKRTFQTGAFDHRFSEIEDSHELIYMFLINNDAILTNDNSVNIFTSGKDKFAALLQDISKAKNHIHLQYYIFKVDGIGKKLLQAVTEKAKQGVKVRILYDELGSRGLRKKMFKELRAAGGEVEVFFPSKLHLINVHLNYRNHRKLAIIDGKIGYVGGFNVGDEYLGLKKKFGHWRDTHLRITGEAVYSIQTRFILDWNQASEHHDIHYHESYFPPLSPELSGQTFMQIVTSGPDSEWEQIKYGYIKLISSAKKTVFIQTPYFIPDTSVLDALRIASLSGIDIRIMIPNKPDHPFVYWATYSYIGELLKAGIKVYIYENGFIHAKMIIVDGKICSVGTANIDVRSFRLNFEVNAFMYDAAIAQQLTTTYYEDMSTSRELTSEQYTQRSLWIRFKESISRLLSPIL